jgi:hypothetical protein
MVNEGIGLAVLQFNLRRYSSLMLASTASRLQSFILVAISHTPCEWVNLVLPELGIDYSVELLASPTYNRLNDHIVHGAEFSGHLNLSSHHVFLLDLSYD